MMIFCGHDAVRRRRQRNQRRRIIKTRTDQRRIPGTESALGFQPHLLPGGRGVKLTDGLGVKTVEKQHRRAGSSSRIWKARDRLPIDGFRDRSTDA